MERAPSQALPHTMRSVERWTDIIKLGEGVNRLGLSGSSVMVARIVGVTMMKGVLVGELVLITEIPGVPAMGVAVGGCVLSTNRSGVNVGSRENGVAVGWGGLVGVGV